MLEVRRRRRGEVAWYFCCIQFIVSGRSLIAETGVRGAVASGLSPRAPPITHNQQHPSPIDSLHSLPMTLVRTHLGALLSLSLYGTRPHLGRQTSPRYNTCKTQREFTARLILRPARVVPGCRPCMQGSLLAASLALVWPSPTASLSSMLHSSTLLAALCLEHTASRDGSQRCCSSTSSIDFEFSDAINSTGTLS